MNIEFNINQAFILTNILMFFMRQEEGGMLGPAENPKSLASPSSA